MATIFELQEERAGIFEKQKAIINRAEDEGRDLTADERAQCDAMDNDLDSIGQKIEEKESDARRRERISQREQEMKTVRNTNGGHRPKPTETPYGAKGGDAPVIRSMFDQLQRSSLRGAGRHEALKELVKQYGSTDELPLVQQAALRFIQVGVHGLSTSERAALQMDVDASGGTLVMPEDFIARLIIGLDEMVEMRRISTVLPMISAESVGVPSLDTDPADADWTTELGIGSEDTAMATGKRTLHPHPLGKLLKVSKTLLRRAAVPAEQLVRERLTFKFAVSEEKGFLTGHGANQPLGVFTASAAGISTGQDMSTDNSTTNVTADGLINAKFNLASQYLASRNLRWLFHRTVVRNIRKLKDGNGQYLWTAGLSGQPDTILEVPYIMSEFAPSTFTTGLYVGIIGDFSWYWIAEALRFELQRLDELYAATNQVGFIGRMEVDGLPVLEEAFTRVKLA